MVIINPRNIINMLAATFSIVSLVITPINERETELHDVIKELISSSLEYDIVDLEEDIDLEFENFYEPHEAQFIEDQWDSSFEAEDNAEDNNYCPLNDDGGSTVNLEYKRRAVEFWTSGSKKRRSFHTVQHRFKNVKSLSQLYRWEQSVNMGGTNRDKFKFITEYTLQKFEEASDRGWIIHDIDIRRWGFEAKSEVDLPYFRAGRWWIWNFKRAHHIVSRKITKFVTRYSREDIDKLRPTCSAFIDKVKPYILNDGSENVYNADESGFNLEVHSGRTLTTQGQKNVEATVQSLSSMTHSYTILPTISASGRLSSPLYLILKETTGSLGPRVQETLFRPTNVHISASKSGKLTSQHFRSWLTDVFVPNTGTRSILLLDSWSGHCITGDIINDIIPSGKNIIFLTIPKKTTGMIQPLDVFGFRIWKNFVRTFSDHVILYDYDINLQLRNNIIKLQSLTHNQFSSPRFYNMFKYAWFKSGYLQERPMAFENPVDFCLLRKEKIIPTCSICGKLDLY